VSLALTRDGGTVVGGLGRPGAVLADKVHSHRSTREALRQRRITTVIPEKGVLVAIARCWPR